jgi:hypothetical protein
MNPQQQTMTMNAARNAQLLFNERFEKKLKETPFPVEHLSDSWCFNALAALKFASILSLGINPEDWMKLLAAFDECQSRMVRSIDLHQFAILSNNLQARTPDDLGMRLLGYGDLMAEADKYVAIWQELSNKLRDEAENEIATELQMKEASAGNGLSAVKD